MAISPQFGVRVSPDKVAKLERLSRVSGVPLRSLMRQLLEEFADVADDLADLIENARRGTEADALEDWAREIVRRSVDRADQLRLPSHD